MLALLFFAPRSARADQQIQVQFNLPIHLDLTVNELGCDNAPGPQITLEGSFALGGLGAELIFQNNVKGTHTATDTFTTDVVLVPVGDKITIPKQPVLGGVGGNPWIWCQFYDDQGVNLTDEILLGRCVQGLKLSEDVLDKALATVVLSASDCSNNPGPFITFDGELSLSGMNVRFIFRNNVKGTHTAQVSSGHAVVIPSGAHVQIPKQPVLGGVGGNPWIWCQLLEGDGEPIGDRIFLGRCVQM